MICPHQCRITNILINKSGAKNDPPNNSGDKIGTYLALTLRIWLLFSVSRTPFSGVGFLLPSSSFQSQSSGRDLAVGDSEDLLGEDIHTVRRGTFVAWALGATLCEHVTC